LIEESVGLKIENLNLRNSPKYFIDIKDVQNVVIRWCNIDTSIFDPNSRNITYPLNTDGIDIAAENVLIYGLTIKSHDDAIAIKPCNLYNTYCKCSSNMLIHDIAITYSCGLAIGSITPYTSHNCIRNITFDKITLNQPYKALYLKTNPNSQYSLSSNMVTASVSEVTFKNIKIKKPLWWVIYFGPQQMQTGKKIR
jgi:polygalacturonase